MLGFAGVVKRFGSGAQGSAVKKGEKVGVMRREVVKRGGMREMREPAMEKKRGEEGEKRKGVVGRSLEGLVRGEWRSWSEQRGLQRRGLHASVDLRRSAGVKKGKKDEKVERRTKTDNREFDKLRQQAVQSGVDPEEANKVMEMLKKSKNWTTAAMKQFFGKSGTQMAKEFNEAPPAVVRIPWRLEMHQRALRDDYHYMTELASNKQAQQQVAQEAAYGTHILNRHHAQYVEQLAKEVLEVSMNPYQSTVPERVGNYIYYARYEEEGSREMSIFCRRRILEEGEEELSGVKSSSGVSSSSSSSSSYSNSNLSNWINSPQGSSASHTIDNPRASEYPGVSQHEQILLDGNDLLAKHSQITIGTMKINSDQSKLLILVDIDGSETYSVLVRDLADEDGSSSSSSFSPSSGLPSSSIISSSEISGISNAEWAPDGKSFFYTEPDTLKRPNKVFLHKIGTPRSQDQLIFSESDDSFFVDVAHTKDRRFITINSNSKTTSEIRILDLASMTTTSSTGESSSHVPKSTLVFSKRPGTEFFMDHIEGHGFIIVTADSLAGDNNYKVMKAADGDVGNMTKWTTLVDSTDEVKIDDMDVFENHLAIYERHNGILKIRVMDLRTKETKYVELPNGGLGHVEPGSNLDTKAKEIRFTYTSPLCPGIVYDYNMETGELKERRRLEVSRVEGARLAFKESDYSISRIMVPSSGGVNVPMTLVHRVGMQPSAENPTLLQAYGAYGHNLDTPFDATLIPLLQRGWVLAYAHIRGGGEMGLKWHREGRLMKKRNSFTDLENCIQYLFDKRITSHQWLVGKAASAGALPFAVVANERPDSFKALVFKSPFLDVTTTMLDPSLPLTVHEYEEWGNPNHRDAFHYIYDYDPYYNMRAQEYPHLYIQSSSVDVRVPCWNHSRFIAKLRTIKTDSNPAIMTLDSTFGHFGDGSPMGVAQSAALQWAFVFNALNIVPSRL